MSAEPLGMPCPTCNAPAGTACDPKGRVHDARRNLIAKPLTAAHIEETLVATERAFPGMMQAMAEGSGWTAQDRMRRQLDEWCLAHYKLPRIGVIRCGDCGAGMATRWRSAGDAVKLGCLDCGLETDIARGRTWKTRNRKRSRQSNKEA